MISLRFSLFVLMCFLLKVCEGQNCDSKVTCSQCIQELNCFWCSSVKNGTSHCLAKTEKKICAEVDVEDPQYFSEPIEDRELTEAEQLRPQRIKVKLRKYEKYEISFQYKQSSNYPVDLYYIMDLSQSMKVSKQRLADLGNNLADEMKRKTSNFRIGFGSFVDKLTLPYVDPTKLNAPCKDCAPPYSFKNHLSLMNDSSIFSQRVRETRMSGNLDSPEGGLDALMQAMVCKNEIGWRPKARHLLVMSTDAVSHIAGDGKLGGVIEPNDATCHMVDNTYTAGLIYDYPSVSQINYVARQNNINIIFANVLTGNDNNHIQPHYQAMSNAIENSKSGNLDKNSDNVVKFISDIYDQIRDSVRITSDAGQDIAMNITSPQCIGFVDGKCGSVKPGQVIDFKAILQPLTCYNDPTKNKHLINIKPEGLGDSLVIELEVICECSCSDQKKSVSEQCNYQGDLECGICRCKEGYFGANCHCDSSKTQSINEDPKLCIKPGSKEICSGQGKCKCGQCECKPRADKLELIYGKYCECDNFSCRLKCSGRGTCDCGTCRCINGWEGPGCECSTDSSQCLSPDTNTMCSGRGRCVCGQCQCFAEGNERYSGKYCEECTSCPAQRCDELKSCVECQAYKTGIYGNGTDCHTNCTTFDTRIVPKLDESVREGVKKCRTVVEKDCAIVFEYSYDEDKNLIVTAEEKRICPEPPPVLALTLGVIGSVLIIGIITLIVWKIVATIHDKNEYARFLEERSKNKWSTGENPLYKPGTSHFSNPAYRRASHRASVIIAAKKAEMEANQSNEQE